MGFIFYLIYFYFTLTTGTFALKSSQCAAACRFGVEEKKEQNRYRAINVKYTKLRIKDFKGETNENTHITQSILIFVCIFHKDTNL